MEKRHRYFSQVIHNCTRHRNHHLLNHRCGPPLSLPLWSPLSSNPFTSSFHSHGSPKDLSLPPQYSRQLRISALPMVLVTLRAARALAAAAAAAAVQELLSDPSHGPLHAASFASATASAAPYVHYGPVVRTSAEKPSASSPSRPCRSTDQLADR